eukprot:s2382_g2.t1
MTMKTTTDDDDGDDGKDSRALTARCTTEQQPWTRIKKKGRHDCLSCVKQLASSRSTTLDASVHGGASRRLFARRRPVAGGQCNESVPPSAVAPQLGPSLVDPANLAERALLRAAAIEKAAA